MQYPTKDLYDDKMDWIEFTTLLAGIMPDTPLGNVISIRAEDDADTLEHFSEEQHRIRDEWRDKQTQRMIESMNKEEVMKEVYAMFMDIFLFLERQVMMWERQVQGLYRWIWR